jgi:hypothetical protein
MSARGFAVERLGVGDWPDTSEAGEMVIAIEKWRALIDHRLARARPRVLRARRPPGPVPRRSPPPASAPTANGTSRSSTAARAPTGSSTAPSSSPSKHKHVGLVVDPASPAASLISDLNQRLNFEVTEVTANEHAQACGMIYDACEQATLRHLGTPELDAASRAPPSAPSATCGPGRARRQPSTSARSSPPPSRTGAASPARRSARSRWSHGADPQDAHRGAARAAGRVLTARRSRRRSRRRRDRGGRCRADLRAGRSDRRRTRAHRVRAARRRRRPAEGGR